MQNKDIGLGKLPIGFVIIKYIYAVIAVISAFLAVFLNPYTDVIFCGIKLGNLPSILINSVLVLFPLVLYFGFLRPTITIWYLAFLYHIFFIGNSFLEILSLLSPRSPIIPFLQISGKSIYISGITLKPELYLKLFSLFNLTTLLGIFILWYLWQRKEYFMPKKLLKNL